MRNYQLILVLKTGLSDSGKKKLTDSVKDWLKSVKIVKEEVWGEKALSYKIKKEESGFFLNYYLESEEVIPADFEKKLFTEEAVLRHLLLKTKSNKKSPPSHKASEDKKEKPKKEKKTRVKKAK